MDVRVKMGSLAKAKVPERQEILTGLPQGSVKTLLEVLSTRHPELAPIFGKAQADREDLRIYVNSDEVPKEDATRYMLRDGDTVSLLLPKLQ
jgi:molybdopterin converting factor small subunit